MQYADIIGDRIDRFRNGYIFTPSEFYDVVDNPVIVSRILGAMVSQGKIRRILKGKYDKPMKSAFGTLPPSIDWQVRAFLFDGRTQIGYMTGTRVFAELGLTTQITSVIEVGSNTYRRAIVRNGYTIKFVLQRNRICAENVPLLQLLDAIRFVKTIPATMVDDALAVIRQKVVSMPQPLRERMAQLAMNYACYVRAVLGVILDEMGDDTTSLYDSLNKASNYNVGSSTFKNKKWRVV